MGLAVVDFSSGLGHIYVNSAGHLRLLLRDAESNEAPAWAPDGTKVAYVRVHYPSNGGGDIFVASMNGRDIERLTSGGGDDEWPSWSPDGSQLAFVSNRRGGKYALFSMPAGGGRIRQLTPRSMVVASSELGGPSLRPAWSPNGQLIAFTVLLYQPGTGQACGPPSCLADAHFGIEILDTRTYRIYKRFRWHASASSPVWSPTGSLLAFVSGPPDDGIWIMRPRDGKTWRLSSGVADQDPVWIDEDHILFVRWVSGERKSQAYLYEATLPPDHVRITRLSRTGGDVSSPAYNPSLGG